VWNGSKPWLVSVPAPHDIGKTLWGHGVGMSASDALGWADDGKTYDWILKYFYTGTVLKKIY
jgi:peptidoglycan hydrolase-like amidase